MGAITKKLQPFQNVLPTGTAVLPFITQGMTFERIVLQRSGGAFTNAMIASVRVMLGGKKVWEVTGAHLAAINQYYKEVQSTNELNIWFCDPRAKNRDDRMIGALDTSMQYSNFSLEVDIAGATTPGLVAWAEMSPPTPKSKNYDKMFRTLIKATNAPQSAAEFTLPISVGSNVGALIRGVHAFHANVTQIQVVKDGFYISEVLGNQLNQAMQNNHARTTQAGMIVWDPMTADFSQDMVPTLRADGNKSTFEFKYTVSAADTIVTYSDLIQVHAGV